MPVGFKPGHGEERSHLLAENYKKVLSAIDNAARNAGRHPEEVRLIAVTKSAGIEDIRRAVALGIKDFGANRVQEEADKVNSVPEARWHFIGHLQRNKVKYVLPVYLLVQTLDRLSLAGELQRCAEKFDQEVKVLVQVNTSGEKSKFGLAPGELNGFLKEINGFDRLNVLGLMTMAPFVDDAEEVRPYFRRLRQLRDENARPGLELPELSMGMTNDFVVAIEEGATMVRIGGALFGRKY